jgi:hypothetical protein
MEVTHGPGKKCWLWKSDAGLCCWWRSGNKALVHYAQSTASAGRRAISAEAAERVLASGMKALGVTDESLANQIKGSPEKYALAWLVRKKTCVRNDWIRLRLKMGSATNFSAYLRRIETAKQEEWGYAAFERIKNING